MKKVILFLMIGLWFLETSAQNYDGLSKLQSVTQKVYLSTDAKDRATSILGDVANAEKYFTKQFNVQPDYTLLVLSPTDWKKFAHPAAIYGIPHYLPDGRLVVASENNEFWKRNMPPLDKIPNELAQRLKATYTDKNGELNLTAAFDLLAVHELGHAFQKAAGMVQQRNWLNELLCNILLHTYLAEKNPKSLPYITEFTQVNAASFPAERLKYTKLQDFDTYYNVIAQQHPDNYGWYQCRFHVVAGQIYDAGGVVAMNSLWNALQKQKEKLDDAALNELLSKTHLALKEAVLSWDKK